VPLNRKPAGAFHGLTRMRGPTHRNVRDEWGIQRFLDCSLSRTEPALSEAEGMSAPHYFLGAIESLAAFATRNFTTVLALI
jgi:hypothetical protein